KRNPVTGIDGDWRDTALQHIYEAYNQNAEEAGLMFGRIFKWIVINRPEAWGGYRSDERHPTFPNRVSFSREDALPASSKLTSHSPLGIHAGLRRARKAVLGLCPVGRALGKRRRFGQRQRLRSAL